jgi:hypothetical protein
MPPPALRFRPPPLPLLTYTEGRWPESSHPWPDSPLAAGVSRPPGDGPRSGALAALALGSGAGPLAGSEAQRAPAVHRLARDLAARRRGSGQLRRRRVGLLAPARGRTGSDAGCELGAGTGGSWPLRRRAAGQRLSAARAGGMIHCQGETR